MIKPEERWHYVENREESEIVQGRPKSYSEGGKWGMISAGMNSREEVILKEGILKDPCCKCGRMVATCYVEPLKSELIKHNMCHTCHFWNEYAIGKNNPSYIRINGHHFVVRPDDPQGDRRWSGHGGTQFKIRKFTGEEITTHNLWAQGEISKKFRDVLEDNAEWIK